MAGGYSYEMIAPDAEGHTHWRVRDQDDNRIATCYVEGNAQLLVEALNEWGSSGAIRAAANELGRARAKHAPMHGPHEGYAVILEELDELWDEVKAQQQDPVKMRKEALQVAAMALRFIEDVCGCGSR